MKFTILINQRILAERFPTLDLADAAILAFLADCFTSPRIKQRTIDGQQWWWIKRTWLASEMPLLGITTKQGITKRINRLRDAEIIETMVADGRIPMLRPGPRWDELSGISPAENGPPEPDESDDQQGGGDNHGCRGVTTTVAGGDNHGCPSLSIRPDHEYQTMKDQDPPSPPEGGGDSRKISKKSKGRSRAHESADQYPDDWQADLPFTTALADYFRQRREAKKPATPTAADLIRKKLLAVGIEPATRALETSAQNGWTGVFPEREKGGATKPGQDEPPITLW